MALDLYAGPLTRYMLGDWENVVARSAREQGLDYQIVRPEGVEEEESASPEEVAEHVVQWTAMLSENLRQHLDAPLTWSDTPTGPYLTDRPSWVGYSALLVCAAQSEHPQYERPLQALEDWSEHPAYKTALTKGVSSKFTQILRPELWIPGRFNFSFNGSNPASGEPMTIGCVTTLMSQLTLLNETVIRASDSALSQALLDGPPQDNSFEGCARFGLAIFLKVGGFAERQNVVLKLDY